jgi:septal ring factor EnvC (AmiA/AmiB activator)|tara:strand:+ start:215 stop:481 length:267 start_codon:yes stop_codon:yes gene_type:complete
MSRRFTQIKKLGICLAAIALPLVVGCGGVSQEEMAALDKQRLTTEASEQKVSSLQAEKARLERKLAEKKATKKALEQKLAATKKNLAN